ncbi:hypothetical protein WJX72_006105 [[Myrmecia] bisecta]|uniref:FAD-binding domain-containing protein n=1 Tax=[Myrmecia] bisecta TaxID=41462 RepID=A0AAW1QF72_9CHLO
MDQGRQDLGSRTTEAHTMKTAIVVGAGPAGLNTAILLANRGYQVQVYDKRVLGSEASKRTYIISVSPRGAKALIEAGVRIPQQGHAIEGLASGARIESQLPSGKVLEMRRLSPTHFFCERRALIEHMVNEAKRLHPTAITFHFDYGLQAVDFERKQATFASAAGKTWTVQYDLLVGADGVNSVTRAQLQKALQQLKVEKHDSDRSIKVFSGLEKPADLVLSDENGSYLRFLTGKNVTRGGMVVWTSPSGHISGAFGGLTTFMKQLQTAKDYETALRTDFPQFPAQFLGDAAAQMEDCPLTLCSASVRCSQLHGPSAVLIGDAGHGVTPTMGQGAVAALESTAVFAKVLDECNGDIQRAVELFTKRRLRDAHALFELDRTANQRLGNDGKLNLHFLGNVFHMWRGRLLHKLAPGIFKGPAVLHMANGDITYAQTHAVIKRDRIVIGGLLGMGLAAAVAGAGVLVSKRLATQGFSN